MKPFQEAEERYTAGIEAKHDKDLAKAREHFQAALEINPDYPQACSELGALAYSEGNFEEAVRLLRQAIALDSDQGNAHLFLALTLGELNEDDAAEPHFQKAILASHHPAVAHAAYGNYLGVRKHPHAERAFQSALEIDPGCVLAIRDYARLLASYGRVDEADLLFKKALRIDPDSAPTNLRYGRFLSCLDHRWEQAVPYLRRALELDPTLVEAQEVLDDLAEEQGLS